MLNIFYHNIYQQKMQVNNVGQHGEIIYPQNLKKYTGSIYENRSKARGKNGKISSFSVCIKVANFKYYKNFSSRVEAESKLRQQNIENNLEIKNILRDCGSHYAVRLFNGKEFLVDKINAPVIPISALGFKFFPFCKTYMMKFR